MDIIAIIAKEIGIDKKQAESAIALLDAGNTVPFIARYRKEATGSLDDGKLRDLSERLNALRSLEKRADEIRRALSEQGVLTPELDRKIADAATLAALEDIYRPYRPKRRTRAGIARERGLEPLAQYIRLQRGAQPLCEYAQRFIDPEKEVPTVDDALTGARDILAEDFADDADLRGMQRDALRRTGVIETSAADAETDSVYRMYYEFSEAVRTLPAHRILAINRGEREGMLKLNLRADDEAMVRAMQRRFIATDGECARQIEAACADSWQRLIRPSLTREIRNELTDRAEDASIREFSRNLQQLLMQPPVKGCAMLGVDPGFRTGCKLAAIDESGRVLDTGVAYFTLPNHEREKPRSTALIRRMLQTHHITAVAIGNGTASRESEAFISDILKDFPGVRYAMVNEAGASVYSASELGAAEFPDYDVTLRSAIAIARRLQDPLAELVKIDPKSIGVGQYQHDLKQARLEEALNGVVESCVSAVGVELSTASAPLLTRVAGIGAQLAKNIVKYRDESGISTRAELKKVPKLGPKAFEQCAGFLRLRDSKNVLDATAVHPESYAAARIVIDALGYELEQMRGGAPKDIMDRANAYGLSKLAQAADVGQPTLTDILNELRRPARDPRDDLPPVLLRHDVLSIDDLRPGMELIGTVRNVIDFGAFVDIGVHQDGLVHISRMANHFIRHPSEVVKIGDVITVWVLEADAKKKRISLSMLPPMEARA